MNIEFTLEEKDMVLNGIRHAHNYLLEMAQRYKESGDKENVESCMKEAAAYSRLYNKVRVSK